MLTTDERRAAIVEWISKQQTVRVSDLSEELGISEVTIRRDLKFLEGAGVLRRTHGGAVSVPNTIAHRSHASKMQIRIAEKERIGQAAADMIRDGDRVVLDSGTTVLQVARHISMDILNTGRLTVITGSVPIISELGHWKGVHLIVVGGIYLPADEVLIGPQAIASLNGLHADKMFCGADGLSFSNGLTTSNLLEAEVDRAMVAASGEVIAVADSSKIGRIGLATIVPLNRLTRLITDTGAPGDFVAELRAQGVDVILV